MATFLVRVELHGAEHDANVYTNLHAAMANANFARFVHYSDGDYWLPTAMYVIEGQSGTCADVRNAVSIIVRQTGYAFQSFVCEIYGSQYCSAGLIKKG
ncbi:MAG TPA: hypothetical protein VFO29_01545 [Candidatus Rubrimentiphilum sp.]|nr:hypothetical protein [Candidatus Rubrimentiphilum sp.]